jgi:hypothetical protein
MQFGGYFQQSLYADCDESYPTEWQHTDSPRKRASEALSPSNYRAIGIYGEIYAIPS